VLSAVLVRCRGAEAGLVTVFSLGAGLAYDALVVSQLVLGGAF